MVFYSLVWLFFCYSFLGWVIETLLAALKDHRYEDRGVLNGPLCPVYGVTGLIITCGLRDLSDSWFFLFLFSALWATVVEWIAGHLLEKFTHTRWWDYSARRCNLDGYICLSVSALWGLLGLVVVEWGAPLLLKLMQLLPGLPLRIALWVLLALLAVDALGTALALAGVHYRLPQVEAVNNRLAAISLRLGRWLLARTERRMVKAHHATTLAPGKEKHAKPAVFAAGCSFYKIVLLFFVGAFMGDLAETVFCRITTGRWMSRSSVVWGPFSIVWGLAIALVTLLLYKYKDKPASFLFITGTLLGGAYEYLCSVFTEIVFGAVFWDYSKLPFNLGGRINLLYSFFWGFAAVAWFRVLYPLFSNLIEKIPIRPGKVVTWVLLVFMVANAAVSTLALARCTARQENQPAQTSIDLYLDEHYDDATMKRIYPNAIRTNK
ncbi:MAG: putative ABC transporter permease [Gemmiger sp.]|nr:putative ABC transporter permease [Gemmiger sp.]